MTAVTQHNIQMLNNPTYAHSIGGMPHGLGLLTTVASLPPKYRSRYLNIKTKCEIPLDLSRKSVSPQLEAEVPMPANFTEVYTETCSDTASQASEEIIDELVKQCQMLTESQTTTTTPTSTTTTTTTTNTSANTETIATVAITKQQPYPEQVQIQHIKPITPPLTPKTPTKRKFSETSLEGETDIKENQCKIFKVENNKVKQAAVLENTPHKPIKVTDSAPKTTKSQASAAVGSNKTNRSNKATRKLKFDEETSSPVSGTIIRPLEDITDGNMQYSNGDIDPKYNIVEITEETKAELAAIKNVIGDYVCKLCRIKFDDAFGLAQHRCACIVLLEYRCPECGKQFNCPANLASHRRWHKPRNDSAVPNVTTTTLHPKKENKDQKPHRKSDDSLSDSIYSCQECGKKFKRQAYLKKHQLIHQQKNSGKQQEKSPATTEETQPIPQRVQTITQIAASLHPAAREVVPARVYDDQDDTMSDYSSSSSSQGYGRLQIIETGLTEEENIAAAALTNLRNCASVIQHTTLAH